MAQDVAPFLRTFGTPDQSRWTIGADALFLHRSDAKPYGVLYDTGTGRELFNASQLGGDWQAGIRVKLSRQLTADRRLDLEYLGIDGWVDQARFDQGNLFLIGDASRSGPPADTANFLYASRLHSVELDIRATDWVWFEPLAGFRWVGLNETYRVNGQWLGFGPSFPYVLDYHTQNNLFGLQVGGVAHVWDNGGPFQLLLVGKGGLFYNDAVNDGSFDGGVFAAGASTQTGRPAFFGELGLTAAWRITDRVVLRGGYQVYLLEGVALAPNQVLATDIATQRGGIDTGGQVLLHGAHVGLQVDW